MRAELRRGLDCIEGHCTRACTRDDVCAELAPGAECVESPESSRAGQCAMWCSQDSACMGLGAGSYCGGAFCVGAELEAESGRKMLFADADHSDCPGRDPYRQSFVDGLPELYLVLTGLLLVER